MGLVHLCMVIILFNNISFYFLMRLCPSTYLCAYLLTT